MSSLIDDYFATASRWQAEMLALRPIVLGAGLAEDWKWKQPCYTHQGQNLVMIAPFAKHCALAFFQGVLLKDEHQLLSSPGKNSQSARQMRFTDVGQISASEAVIADYLTEAMGHVESGIKVEFAAKDALVLPVELKEAFAEVDGLGQAFAALTPGRQRGFVLHIEGAKQSATRRKRADSHVERIMAGKGIHDCVCGKSARMPRCDGSHSR